jgi:hypothetical protein
VPLTDIYPRMVLFVLARRTGDDGVDGIVPVGTAFQVCIGSEHRHNYVVTAAHVVSGEPETWVRANTTMTLGETKDVAVPRWYLHPTEDVAVAPFNENNVWLSAFPVEWFADTVMAENRQKFNVSSIDTREHRPGLGDRVYFMGLLANVPHMGDRNIAMVRSGTIGALYQERVPIWIDPRTVAYRTAHLIDCRSYEGFSGSPCFTQHEAIGTRYTDGQPTVVDITFLLGVVSHHFDNLRDATMTGALAGSVGKVKVPAHTGVGVVTPVEHVRETLDLEELVEERQQRAAASGERESGAAELPPAQRTRKF